MWVGPQALLGGPPAPWDPSPKPACAAPRPRASPKEPEGWGKREGEGGEGRAVARGKGLPDATRDGGDLPKGGWGQTPHLGGSRNCHFGIIERITVTDFRVLENTFHCNYSFLLLSRRTQLQEIIP